MAVDNNIFVRITGETNMDAVSKKLKSNNKVVEDLTKEIAALTTQEHIMEEHIKKTAATADKMNKSLAANTKKYAERKKAIEDQINAQKHDIAVLSANAKAANLLEGSSKSVTSRIREMREAMMEMEDASLENLAAYEALAVEAAKLADQQGDLQTKIRVLASDTKELDAAMSLGSGLAGGFTAATSAMELLGGETEGLERAFYKVQATLSVLNGVQSVANALNKDSAFRIVATNAAQSISIGLKKAYAAVTGKAAVAETAEGVATEGAATAQWGLNTALLANPIGAVIASVVALTAVVWGLASALNSVFGWWGDDEKAMSGYERAQEKLDRATERNTATQNKYNAEIARRKGLLDAARDAELREAERANKSAAEKAQIELKYAKQSEKIVKGSLLSRIESQKKEVEAAKKAKAELEKLGKSEDAKSLKRLKADMEKRGLTNGDFYRDIAKMIDDYENSLLAADEKIANAEKALNDIKREGQDASQDKLDAEHKVNEELLAMQREAAANRRSIQRASAARDIADIRANYEEQLKLVQGEGKEETELRKSIKAKMYKEIADVRKQYAQREREARVLELQNEVDILSRMRGKTEAIYADELDARKAAIKAEGEAQLAALDKNTLSDKEYAAQREKIINDTKEKVLQITEQENVRRKQLAKDAAEGEVAVAQNAYDKLTGAEELDKRLEVYDALVAARKDELDKERQLEYANIEASGKTAEEMAARKKQVDAKYEADKTALTKESEQERLNIINGSVQAELERRASVTERIAQNEGNFLSVRLQAVRDNLAAQKALYDNQEAELDELYAKGVIKKDEYEQKKFEITQARLDAEGNAELEQIQMITDAMSKALEVIGELSGSMFDLLQSNVQAELDALDEEYTTDAAEAAKNANKKYISEKEYEEKKAKLQQKQAKYKKAQAMSDIAIQTALAIIQTIGQLGATPWGLAMAAIAGTMGAVQLAVAASKPLAQYAKGRDGGPGEYALVGEKGPEIMYVPKGASIVPNDKIGNPSLWSDYGVPTLQMPAMPTYTGEDFEGIMSWRPIGQEIDYDKLGKAVAANIPVSRPVTVNVDGSGVHVSDNGNRHTYLNKKYNASWS